ncbi:MAG: hypothetical protein DCC68_19420 [Planctomycetota bacterium]|nr:MAG: hypothetical protein DCC68_19420 [Planctomycetota bacterium]
MTTADRTATLNRLLQIHYRSLPMYLASARPWVPRGHEKAAETLELIVEDQKRTVDKITHALLDLGADIDLGEFPMVYTDLHDLSVDYVLKELVEAQRRDVAAIEDCVADLAGDPLAQEALGAAKGHLESLEEAVAETAAR